MKTLIFILLSAFVVGCGIQKDAHVRATSNSACAQLHPDTQESFKASLHPKLIQNCASCHGDFPVAPSTFAMTNFSKAYSPAKDNTNFTNPDSSYLIQKMNQGHNCAGKCNTLASDFRAAILEWKKAEDAALLPLCDGSQNSPTHDPTSGSSPILGNYITTQIFIPATTSTSDTIMAWNLGANLSLLEGAHLRFSVKRTVAASPTSPGTFTISKVTLGSSQKQIKIDSISIVINRVNTSYSNFKTTDFVVAPQPFDPSQAVWPFFNVSLFSQEVTFENISGDYLQLSFNIQETTLPPSPDPNGSVESEVQLYNRTIAPTGAVFQASCRGCHQNRIGAGQFNMSGTNTATWRTNTFPFINTNNVNQSVLLQNPLGMNGHPNILSNTSSQWLILQAWVQKRVTAPSP